MRNDRKNTSKNLCKSETGLSNMVLLYVLNVLYFLMCIFSPYLSVNAAGFFVFGWFFILDKKKKKISKAF